MTEWIRHESQFAPPLCRYGYLEMSAYAFSSFHGLANILNLNIKMNWRPVSIVSSPAFGVCRARLCALVLGKQIDGRSTASQLDAGRSESSGDLQAKCTRVERNGAFKVRHIDVNKQVHIPRFGVAQRPRSAAACRRRVAWPRCKRDDDKRRTLHRIVRSLVRRPRERRAIPCGAFPHATGRTASAGSSSSRSWYRKQSKAALPSQG